MPEPIISGREPWEVRDGPWRGAELRYLLENYRLLSLREIARNLHRSICSVRNKLRSLSGESGEEVLLAACPPRRAWTEEERARLEELIRSGCTLHGIARELHRSAGSVERQWRRRFPELPFRGDGCRSKLTPEEVARILELHRGGVPRERIARLTGRSYAKVSALIHDEEQRVRAEQREAGPCA